MRYDAVILGCGPGGMAACRVLAGAGKKVACVDPDHWGGTCLNEGCIPTKFFLAATKPGEALQALARQKVLAGAVNVNYADLHARTRRRVNAMKAAVKSALETLGATLIAGRGVVVAPDRIEVENASGEIVNLEAERLILAAGGRPAILPGLIPDHRNLLDSADALRLKQIPKSLAIVGSGAVGLEFASFYSSLGAKITLIEAAPRLSPGDDADISAEAYKLAQKRGYEIRVGSAVVAATIKDDGAELSLSDGEKIFAEKILLAVGRAGLGKEIKAGNAGCRVTPEGCVATDENLSAAPGVFAIGDINGRVLLAHAASAQGTFVAKKILGAAPYPYRAAPIPACTHGAIEILRVGLTAREAGELGDAEVSLTPFAANPIAQAEGETAGFVKAVWQKGALVGMAAIGANATDLAAAAELLVAGNYGPDKLDEIMIAHPSLAEALVEAIRAKRVHIS